MTKYLKSLISFLGILLVLFIVIFSAKLITLRDLSKTDYKKIKYVLLDRKIISSFKSLKGGLNRVDLMFRNPDLLSKNEYEIVLYNENGLAIIKRPLSGYNIGDPGEFRIDFPYMGDSENKDYLIEINPTSKEGQDLFIGMNGNTGEVVVNQYFVRTQKINDLISQTVNTFVQFIYTNYLALILVLILLALFYYLP